MLFFIESNSIILLMGKIKILNQNQFDSSNFVYYKLNRSTGSLEKSYSLTGLRPYFIANHNFIYGIINDAKKVVIFNLDLEKMTEISYNDAYDKFFANTNGSDLILRSGISPYFLKL
jgi:hypothetical protein